MNNKRYTIGSKPATSGPPLTCMVEDDAGEWVRHEDLAEATRQLDELVEAVNDRADGDYYDKYGGREWRCGSCGTVVQPDDIAPIETHADNCLYKIAARIQSAQPKGEWIDIESDGSNLPEYVGLAYRVAYWTSPELFPWKRDRIVETWGHLNHKGRWIHHEGGFYLDRLGAVAFWSTPYIPSKRPDIPAYQPKEQRDEQ